MRARVMVVVVMVMVTAVCVYVCTMCMCVCVLSKQRQPYSTTTASEIHVHIELQRCSCICITKHVYGSTIVIHCCTTLDDVTRHVSAFLLGPSAIISVGGVDRCGMGRPLCLKMSKDSTAVWSMLTARVVDGAFHCTRVQ